MKQISTAGKGHACPSNTMAHPFNMHRRINELFESLFHDFEEIRIPHKKKQGYREKRRK